MGEIEILKLLQDFPAVILFIIGLYTGKKFSESSVQIFEQRVEKIETKVDMIHNDICKVNDQVRELTKVVHQVYGQLGVNKDFKGGAI